MYWFLFLMLLSDANPDIIFLRDFEQPGNLAEYMAPYQMTVGPDGRIFLMDQDNHKVVIWNKDGTYLKTFGKKGGGPGEIGEPWSIAVDGDEFLLWDYNQKVTVYDLDGNYKRAFRTAMRAAKVFMPLGGQRYLSTRQVRMSDKPGVSFQIFEIFGGDGKNHGMVKRFEDESIMKTKPGVNVSTRDAFPPEPAMQIDLQGNRWYGFSQEPTLRQVNEQGEEVETRRFELPVGEPTDKEKDMFLAISFPRESGGRFTWADAPNLHWRFGNEKAHYTLFLFIEDKVVFILLPIGGMDEVPRGFNWGSYYVNDAQTGKALTRGEFQFPEDSRLFFDGGRMLAALTDENGDYQFKEFTLKGL